jgi:hypothetical protein
MITLIKVIGMTMFTLMPTIVAMAMPAARAATAATQTTHIA